MSIPETFTYIPDDALIPFLDPDIVIKNDWSLSSHSTVKNTKETLEEKLLLKIVEEQNRGKIKYIYFGL